MTDPVDQLLHDAGERWRAAQPEPPALRPIRPRRWGVLATAAVAVFVVAGGAIYLTKPSPLPPSPSGFSTGDLEHTVASSNVPVVDGHVVEASGRVRQVGDETRFCAPAATTLLPGGDDCPHYVRVEGVDMSKLVDGQGHLRGTWRQGTLTVTSQGPPRPTSIPSFTSPTAPSLPNAQLIYQEADKVLGPLMQDRTNGIYGSGMPAWQFIEVEVIVLTPALNEKLAAIKGAPLVIKPWLSPVR